jgi:hypothetical protein
MADTERLKLMATIALHVYRKEGNTPALPIGWKYIDCPQSLQQDGYFGSAYYLIDETTKKVQVVLAQRGTDNWQGTVEDFAMWLKDKAPKQLENGALPFLQEVLFSLNNDFPKSEGWVVEFSNTGHSLGATIAELITAYFGSQTNLTEQYPNLNLSFENKTPCTNFDSPGSGSAMFNPLIQKGLLTDAGCKILAELLQTICADIDAINTCCEHVNKGRFWAIDVGYDWLPSIEDKLPLKTKDIHNAIYWTNKFSFGNQHPMAGIYNAIMTCKLMIPCDPTKWTDKTYAGFQVYLNHKLPEGLPTFHMVWWEGYMALLWQQYPELHKKYVDFLAFRQEFIHQNLRNDFNLNNDISAPNEPARFFNKTNKSEHDLIDEKLNLLRQLSKIYHAQITDSMNTEQQKTNSTYFSKAVNMIDDLIGKLIHSTEKFATTLSAPAATC